MSTSRTRLGLLFGAIALGACGTAGSGTPTTTPDDGRPRAQLSASSEVFDHWHAAFAVEVCGVEQAPLQDAGPDLLGIHTHGDGLVHIHPFSTKAAGTNATLGRFFDVVGISIDDGQVSMPPLADASNDVRVAERSCGSEPAHWVLARWDRADDAAAGRAPDETITKDLSTVRFSKDYQAFTLALVTDDETSIGAPSSAAEIVALSKIDM